MLQCESIVQRKMLPVLQLVLLSMEIIHFIWHVMVVAGFKMERILPRSLRVYYFSWDGLSAALAFAYILLKKPALIDQWYMAFIMMHFAIHSMATLHLAFPRRSFYWTKAMENVFRLAEGAESTNKEHTIKYYAGTVQDIATHGINVYILTSLM